MGERELVWIALKVSFALDIGACCLESTDGRQGKLNKLPVYGDRAPSLDVNTNDSSYPCLTDCQCK